jgi:hypothetical protein
MGEGENLMTRALPLIVAGLVLAAPAALAQSSNEDSDDKRYTLNPVEGGYLRLDGRTGQVSFCNPRSVGWACQMLPDERSALEAEIARLQMDNAALKRELIARNLPLPKMVKPDTAPTKPQEPSLQLPSDADLKKMMAFMEKLWRSLIEMIGTVQKDMLNKSQ